MTISKAVRKQVMERDNGNCQFWHTHAVPGTEISHKDHQGVGGLPPDHWKNQPSNLAASCSECHARFSGPGDVFIWEDFRPNGVMKILDPDGNRVPEEDLWFYNRSIKYNAEEAVKSLQTIGVIDNLIGEMMHNLRCGALMLDDGVEFDETISGLGWDPVKANQIADIYEWAQEYGGWPEETPFSKIELLFKTDFSPLEDMEPDKVMGLTPQQFLGWAGSGASYSNLKDDLVKAGLRQRQQRNYCLFDMKHLEFVFVRTRKEKKLSEVALERGFGVLKINSFKGRLKYQRGKDGGIIDKHTAKMLPLLTLDEWLTQLGGVND